MSITIDDFGKVEIRIGTVLEATKVPDADRLIKLIFDFGPMPDVIVSEAAASGKLVPLGERQSDDEISHFVRNDNTEEIATSPSAPRNDDIVRIPEFLEKYPGRDVRQIMSAIAPFIPDPSVLVGKQIAVCTNLEPRKFRGYVSQGMIMATDDGAETLSLLVPEKKVEPGSKIH